MMSDGHEHARIRDADMSAAPESVLPPMITPTPKRRWPRGGLVTAGTIVVLIVAVVATLLGTGVFDHAVASFDASSWLFSKQKGEIARVNGVTGKVDTRTQISDGEGHSMQVTQNDRYVILRDLITGKVSVLDLSSLQISATTQTTAGLGVTVALHDDSAFVVDSVQGTVRQLNPSTLTLVGEPLNFPPGLSGGQFDSDGQLWILVPSEGTAVAVTPAPLVEADSAEDGAAGVSTETTSGNPTIATTLSVADPSHELTLSVLDDGVAVLDKTSMTLVTVQGDQQTSVDLALNGSGALPVRTVGSDVPVTVVDDRQVYVVTDTTVREFTVPGDSPSLQACTAWSGRLYCPDDSTGEVYVLDSSGNLTSTISVPNNGVALELEVREGRLFINAPGSANARVVDDDHNVKTVNKYANDVLGGDPPQQVTTTPPTPATGPPSAPAEVKATAGNSQVRLTWSAAAANGYSIIKYVVEGDGQTHDVGANQRALDITGLTNGQKYTFTVYAVNSKGSGPKKSSNQVVPTAEVPDAPVSITAEAKPDGTVVVTWPAANGQGNKIARYDVTATSTGSQEPAGSSTTTSLTIAAGKLTYGTQYAFSVTAVSDTGAASEASPVSATVVPYAPPSAPTVTATTAGDKQGAVNVSWTEASENGRAVTKYVVTAGSVTQEVSSTSRSATISGLSDGATVTVKVHAVNEAGDGKEGTTTAKTLEQPTVSAVSASGTASALTVSFKANVGGASTSSCAVAVAGYSTVTGSCSSITVSSLPSSTSYSYTVSVTTPAGSATATGTQSTDTVTGVAYCQNNTSSSDKAQWTWCNSGENALEAQSNPATLHSGQVGKTTHGNTYTAYCYTTGVSVEAYVYNNNKTTNIWVKINFDGGQYYTPLAWFNVDGKNTVYTGALPHC